MEAVSPGRQILIHCTTREAPELAFLMHFLVILLLLLVVWGPCFEGYCDTPYTFLEDSFHMHVVQTLLSKPPFFIYCSRQHSLGCSGECTGLLFPRPGRSFPSFQQLCLVLLRPSASSRDLLVSRTPYSQQGQVSATDNKMEMEVGKA